MGRIKTNKWRSAGIALCAIAVAICAFLMVHAPQQAFATEPATADGNIEVDGDTEDATKGQSSSDPSDLEYDENEATIYIWSSAGSVSAEMATSEAALAEALEIIFCDSEDNPLEFSYGTDYTIEWYEGYVDGSEGNAPLSSFPNEPGPYSAKIIANNLELIDIINFDLCNPNDISALNPQFGTDEAYADGTEVTVEKLGGLTIMRYDAEIEDWVEVNLTEGVDYDVVWFTYDSDTDEETILDPAPKDAGEYYARIIAKGDTYTGTCDMSFSIVGFNDIGDLNFTGADHIKYTGSPITESELALKAYWPNTNKVIDNVEYEVVGWNRIVDDEDEGQVSEPVNQSDVVDPGMYEVELEGVNGYTGTAWYAFEIVPANSLFFAEVTGVAKEYAYTGKPIAVKPVVKMDGRTLVEERDYDLAFYYDDYEYVDSVEEAGSYSLEISAIEGGDYEGSCSVGFRVKESGKPSGGNDDEDDGDHEGGNNGGGGKKTPNHASASVGAKIAAGKASYKVTRSGSAPEVALSKSAAAGSFTVPAAVKSKGVSYKVTSIAANAFKGNKKLKKVVVGDNIVAIGKSAFEKCTGLRAATLGARVKAVGKSVFKGDKKLRKVTVRSGALTKASARNIVKGSKIKKVKLSGKAAKAKKKAYKKYFGKRAKVK